MSSKMMSSKIDSFHDGQLRGFRLVANKTCEVYLDDVKGKRFKIVLSGVERLRADDFMEGNIIFEVLGLNGDEVTIAEIEDAVSVTSGQHRPWVEKIRGRVCAGNLTLFRITSSYGCSMVCVCESIGVFPDGIDE